MNKWNKTLGAATLVFGIIIWVTITGLVSSHFAGQRLNSVKDIISVNGRLVDGSDFKELSTVFLNLQELNIVDCIKLYRIAKQPMEIFNSGTKSVCIKKWHESDNAADISFTSMNGFQWRVFLLISNSSAIRFLSFISYILGPLCLFLIYFIIKSKISARESVYLNEINVLQEFNSIAQQVAHDIRSPISALNVILTTTPLDIERKEILSIAIERINSISNDFLSSTTNMIENKVSSVVSNYDCIDLRLLLNEILFEKKIICPENIEISYQEPDGTLKVKVIRHDIKRVLSNLINNSIESIGKSCGKIDIKCLKFKDYIIILVNDNGPGATDKTLENIGIKGFSTKNLESGTKGNGLGISHAKQIVAKHRGTIKFSNLKSGGFSVEIALPVLN